MTTEKIKRNDIEWLRQEIDYYGRYHDHKETMAWAATVFYIAGILSLSSYVGSLDFFDQLYWKIPSAILIVSFGFLILRFIWWQFRNRWIASVKVRIYKQALVKELFGCEHPSKNEETCKIYCVQWKQALVQELFECKYHSQNEETYKICCVQWRKAFKSIIPKMGCKTGDKYKPLESEAITYVGIFIVTIVAIVLICIN